MTYSESFLSTCDAEGKAPSWAIKQIFEEHGHNEEDRIDYMATTGNQWDDGEMILEWLGY